MKKIFFMIVAIASLQASSYAQNTAEELRPALTKLDGARKQKEYGELAKEFAKIAATDSKSWLPWYYAAFCNAKTAWLYQDDPDKIEAYADAAEEQISKAADMLDKTTQKTELSEVYCVQSMLNQARVFQNPAVYGMKFGPTAARFRKMAYDANPQNPRALYLMGWEKFASPKAFGGDKVKAKELLTTAKQNLQTQTHSDSGPHWGKMEVDDLLSRLK